MKILHILNNLTGSLNELEGSCCTRTRDDYQSVRNQRRAVSARANLEDGFRFRWSRLSVRPASDKEHASQNPRRTECRSRCTQMPLQTNSMITKNLKRNNLYKHVEGRDSFLRGARTTRELYGGQAIAETGPPRCRRRQRRVETKAKRYLRHDAGIGYVVEMEQGRDQLQRKRRIQKADSIS